MICIKYNFYFRNGQEQQLTLEIESQSIAVEKQKIDAINDAIHQNMYADIGAVLKLHCVEGYYIIRLSDIQSVVVKGLEDLL